MSAGESKGNQAPKVVGGYELISKLGQGGMGAVFKARQQSLDRIVALKVLPKSIAKDSRFIERFQREARASAKLNHPNIVQGIDVGKDEALGLWYFAMEYVDGPNLQQLLKEQKVIPETRALEIMRDITRALESAAAHNIVHRDIKPDNILLTTRGEAKLADLGLAKQIDNQDASVTQSGQTVGTPNYMAPEQVRGQTNEIDIRTDLYALGSTFFHLMTGKTPFDGPTSAVIMSKHLTEAPPKAHKVNPAVSEASSRMIERLMQKKKEQRYQTPTELVQQIDRVLNGDTGGPRQPVRVTGHHTTRKREPVGGRSNKAVLIGAGMAVVAAIGVFLFLNAGHKNSAPETAALEKKATIEPKTPTEKSVAPKKEIKTKPEPEEKKPEKAEVEPKKTPEISPGPINELVVSKNKEIEKTDADSLTIKPAPDKPEKKDEPATTPGKPEKPATPEPEPAKIAAPQNNRAWGGFAGEYYIGQNFDTLKFSQVDPVIDFNWPKGAPANLQVPPKSGVSMRWKGFVEPDETGDYTFEVTADDGARLFLDERPIWDSWSGRPRTGKTFGVALEKGKKYPIRFEMRNASESAGASLAWSFGSQSLGSVHADPPETEKQGMPIGHLNGGWRAEYGKLDSEVPLVKRLESYVNWNWGYGSPAAEIPADKFWGRWMGLVVPPETDDYVFQVSADEVARLFINEMLIVDFWGLGAGTHESPPLRLEGGKRYLIRLEYNERSDAAGCELRWSSSKVKQELVPAVGAGQPDEALPPDGFLAEYGSLGNPKVLLSRREIRAGWNWKYASPADEISPEKFWGRYTGWITPPADGEYIFSLSVDEGLQFFIDDVMLFDSAGRPGEIKHECAPVTLKGGKHYSLRAEYYDRSDYAHLDIQWRSATMTKRTVSGVVPDTFSLDAKDVGHLDTALVAEYGSNKNPLIRRFEARIYHDFSYGTPGPEIPSGVFWGKWTGGLRVPVAGNYVFKLDAEATAEIKINGVSVVKAPPPAPKSLTKSERSTVPSSAESQQLPLAKGTTYFLEITMTSKRPADYQSYIKLSWKPPGKTEFEDVPPDVFLLPPNSRAARK